MQKNDKEHMLGKKIPNNSSFPFQIKKKGKRNKKKEKEFRWCLLTLI